MITLLSCIAQRARRLALPDYNYSVKLHSALTHAFLHAPIIITGGYRDWDSYTITDSPELLLKEDI